MAKLLQQYINGGFRDGNGTETMPVTNPATQEVLIEVPIATMAEIDEAVAAAKTAFSTYSCSSKDERIALLEKIIAA